MAEIVRLEQFHHSVRTPSGVRFPTVHRVTGCHWGGGNGDEPPATTADLIPDPTWPDREYSLSPAVTVGMANLACEPIERLDPVRDRGWVVVRHHRNLDLAHAYLDGLDDCDQDLQLLQKLWQTPDGIFTLYHREIRKRGCRDCLLIYSMSADWPDLAVPWCHIIASDGSTFSDPDILLPPDL